jgi:two-component system NtrC family sensor kinase
MVKISNKSIQSQLILYFTIAILTPVIIISIIASKIIYDQIIKRAESKTIADLNSANEIYNHRISQLESITRLTAGRSFIVNSAIEKNADTLRSELEIILKNEKLDIFTMVDKNGVVICRARNSFNKNDSLLDDRFIKRVLETKKTVSGTDIISEQELAKESFELVERAYMDIKPTPKSRERREKVERNGMMMKSAVPLFDRNKNLVGVLMAGILLNRTSWMTCVLQQM